jgi:hypothetical protein
MGGVLVEEITVIIWLQMRVALMGMVKFLKA